MRRWSGGGGKRIDVAMDRLSPAHPGFGPNAADPVRKARDETEILDDVLLADQPDRHDATGRYRDRCAEDTFEHEDAFGMMAERAVPEISRHHLALVHPGVKRQIIFREATPFANGGKGVMIWMRHRRFLKTRR